MDAPDPSDELMRRGDELRAQSVRIRAVADEKMEKSRRLIAASQKAHEAVMHAHGWKSAGRSGGATVADWPAGRREERTT